MQSGAARVRHNVPPHHHGVAGEAAGFFLGHRDQRRRPVGQSAAAVVGGVSTNGGIGSPFGAFLGAILIDVLENSLIRWLAISEFWRDALLGLLILLAVATDTVIMNRLRKLWSQHELQVTEDDTTVPPGKQGDKGYAV